MEQPVKLQLRCGVQLEIFQDGSQDVFQVTVTPAEGRQLSDGLVIKDNQARIVINPDVAAELYVILASIFRIPETVKILERRAWVKGVNIGMIVGPVVFYLITVLLRYLTR